MTRRDARGAQCTATPSPRTGAKPRRRHGGGAEARHRERVVGEEVRARKRAAREKWARGGGREGAPRPERDIFPRHVRVAGAISAADDDDMMRRQRRDEPAVASTASYRLRAGLARASPSAKLRYRVSDHMTSPTPLSRARAPPPSASPRPSLDATVHRAKSPRSSRIPMRRPAPRSTLLGGAETDCTAAAPASATSAMTPNYTGRAAPSRCPEGVALHGGLGRLALADRGRGRRGPGARTVMAPGPACAAAAATPTIARA